MNLNYVSSKFRLVELFHQFSSDQVLAIFDVDLTLRDTMCTNTPPEQRLLMTELYERTSGGVILKSGRSALSLDETFDGALPLSGEHHSCIRIEQNGDVIALAPDVDTREIANNAVEEIQNHIKRKHRIVSSPESVRQNSDDVIAVYPEVKQFAVALVHSLNHHHDDIKQFQGNLEIAAQDVLGNLGLSETHEVRTGSDAVEIVSRGLTQERAKQLILSGEISENEVNRLLQYGLNKGTALHNFMSLPDFSGRTPYVIGDSGTDGVAMVEAQKYGGGGVWILNQNPITNVKPEFKAVVEGRYIDNYNISWDHIREVVEHLREEQRVYQSEAVSAPCAGAN